MDLMNLGTHLIHYETPPLANSLRLISKLSSNSKLEEGRQPPWALENRRKRKKEPIFSNPRRTLTTHSLSYCSHNNPIYFPREIFRNYKTWLLKTCRPNWHCWAKQGDLIITNSINCHALWVFFDLSRGCSFLLKWEG